MGKYLLKLPKMGESIAEATITNWLKEVGDSVDIDESIVEIATDKVDSDVPSEFKGKLVKKNFEVNDVVKVGEVIAEIETSSEDNNEIKIVSKEKDKELTIDDVEETIKDPEIASIPSIDLLKTIIENPNIDNAELIDAFNTQKPSFNVSDFEDYFQDSSGAHIQAGIQVKVLMLSAFINARYTFITDNSSQINRTGFSNILLGLAWCL